MWINQKVWVERVALQCRSSCRQLICADY